MLHKTFLLITFLTMLVRGSSFLNKVVGASPIRRNMNNYATPPFKLVGAQDLLSKTDVFIFDCDGVIWKGDALIPGVSSVLEKIRAMGKKIFFVTNNSTKSRKGYLKKFTGLGLDIKPEGLPNQNSVSSKFHCSPALQRFFQAALLQPHILSKIHYLSGKRCMLSAKRALGRN